MKKKVQLFALLCAVGIASVLLQASGETPVVQGRARLDAARSIATSATSSATLTLTPSAGETVYIYEIDVANCAGASAVTAAAVTTITTTNLNGLALTLGSGATAGLCQPFPSIAYPTGLMAATPGTAVTFVLPAFATNQTVRLNVAWASAPAQ